MKINILILFLVLFQLSFKASAQISEKMKAIHNLVGKYSVTTFDYEKDSWKEGLTTSSNIEMVHEGAFLKEQVVYQTENMKITMLTYIGFDSRVGKYKLCAMDKEFQSMDIYYGERSDEKFIFTNLKSDKPFVLKDGAELHFRLTYLFNSQGYIHLVESTKDKGVTWNPFSKSIYKKL